MEILAIIGLIAIGWFIWMATSFARFRGRLLRAFEAHGLPRALANDIYTAYANQMNDMRINKGMTPEAIALQYIRDIEMLNDVRRSRLGDI